MSDKGPGRALPVMQERAPQRQVPPPQQPIAFPHLGQILAISSGKGGVGKSTVATNLAVALAKSGARVGLMDADVYGPNVPRMMGVNAPPAGRQREDRPARGARREDHQPRLPHRARSAGDLARADRDEDREPVPADVAWGQLDYFIVDMPPGTGDAQLSLVQATHVRGAIIVTTPQEVAVGRRAPRRQDVPARERAACSASSRT